MNRAKGTDKQSLLLQMGKVGEEVDSALKKMRIIQVGNERKGRVLWGRVLWGREGKGREGKGREGKGRVGYCGEGKAREGKGREGYCGEGKERKGKLFGLPLLRENDEVLLLDVRNVQLFTFTRYSSPLLQMILQCNTTQCNRTQHNATCHFVRSFVEEERNIG